MPTGMIVNNIFRTIQFLQCFFNEQVDFNITKKQYNYELLSRKQKLLMQIPFIAPLHLNLQSIKVRSPLGDGYQYWAVCEDRANLDYAYWSVGIRHDSGVLGRVSLQFNVLDVDLP